MAGILSGAFTATESASVAVLWALFLSAVVYRRLTWDLLWQGMTSTMRINAMVIFILIGSTVFGLVFRGVDGDLQLVHRGFRVDELIGRAPEDLVQTLLLLARELELGWPVFATNDAREGPKAFAERRDPRYTGT